MDSSEKKFVGDSSQIPTKFQATPTPDIPTQIRQHISSGKCSRKFIGNMSDHICHRKSISNDTHLSEISDETLPSKISDETLSSEMSEERRPSEFLTKTSIGKKPTNFRRYIFRRSFLFIIFLINFIL